MKNFIKEFKEFAFKGNLMDLALGVIIGGAVAGLVKSLVEHVLMPIVGWIFGGQLNFNSITLGPILIGRFITNLVDFIILALVLFLIIKAINRFKKKEEAVAGPTVEELLTDIREELRKKNM